ncbi:hypothetical protein CYMTET_10762 [Cymbomonas tetramitiformis]|uniref:Uncharacterized protein n=1 Tax=Cymbomonas tetramitiformis TaxID=36881 RepID=A0AAE0LE55_9CHLO|nr:hypothetical protein CYMTET_10762 [Cymbomonas tetramitiformis]
MKAPPEGLPFDGSVLMPSEYEEHVISPNVAAATPEDVNIFMQGTDGLEPPDRDEGAMCDLTPEEPPCVRDTDPTCTRARKAVSYFMEVRLGQVCAMPSFDRFLKVITRCSQSSGRVTAVYPQHYTG